MSTMQASLVKVGDAMPVGASMTQIDGYDVPTGPCVVEGTCAVDDCCGRLAVDAFAEGTHVIVGMPGAFTPTCTDEHLPGYIRSAGDFRKLGASVSVLTTNDPFIMTAWKKAMRECMQQERLATIDTEVSMIADRESEFVKALGVAFNMAPPKGAAWSFQVRAPRRSHNATTPFDPPVPAAHAPRSSRPSEHVRASP